VLAELGTEPLLLAANGSQWQPMAGRGRPWRAMADTTTTAREPDSSTTLQPPRTAPLGVACPGTPHHAADWLQRHLADRTLRRLAPIQEGRRDVGGNDQHIGLQLARHGASRIGRSGGAHGAPLPDVSRWHKPLTLACSVLAMARAS